MHCIMGQKTKIFNNSTLSISKLPTVSGNVSCLITKNLPIYLLRLISPISLRHRFFRSRKYKLFHNMNSFLVTFHLCSIDLFLPCYQVLSKVLDVFNTLLRDCFLFKTEIRYCIPWGMGIKSCILPVV